MTDIKHLPKGDAFLFDVVVPMNVKYKKIN